MHFVFYRSRIFLDGLLAFKPGVKTHQRKQISKTNRPGLRATRTILNGRLTNSGFLDRGETDEYI